MHNESIQMYLHFSRIATWTACWNVIDKELYGMPFFIWLKLGSSSFNGFELDHLWLKVMYLPRGRSALQSCRRMRGASSVPAIHKSLVGYHDSS